jgi:hypothetical protein
VAKERPVAVEKDDILAVLSFSAERTSVLSLIREAEVIRESTQVPSSGLAIRCT